MGKAVKVVAANAVTLFDKCEAGDDEIKINKDFARRFEIRKNKQEQQKLIDEAIKKSNEDSTSDSDLEAELATKHVNAKVLETISRIKLKRKEIYDKERTFFANDDFEQEKKVIKPTKPLTYTKFVNSALCKEGADVFSRAEEDLETNVIMATTSSYEKEQMQLKKAFLQAASGVDDGDDFLLERKEKTEEEEKEEVDSFREFLVRKASDKAADERQLLERYFQEALDVDEAFLRDYILYEGWKEGSKMPENLVAKKKKFGADHCAKENEDDESDFENNTEAFESAYNLRFETGAQVEIKGHSRKVLDSVRQKDEKRKRKRMEKLARKQAEKEEFRAETSKAKKLKRAELVQQWQRVQQSDMNGGDLADSLQNYQNDDDEHSAHKRKKQANIDDEAYPPIKDEQLSDEQDYNEESSISKIDDPCENDDDPCENDDGPCEDYAQNSTTVGNSPAGQLWFMCDGCGFGIPGGAKRYDCFSCDNFTLCSKCFKTVRHPHHLVKRRVPLECHPPCDDDDDDELITTSGTRSETSTSSPSSALANSALPNSVLSHFVYRDLGLSCDDLPKEITEEKRAMLEKWMNEYYSLDYEDVIGKNCPIRFKYVKVEANDFGLSVDDILSKSDKELNQHVSIKKLAPYKTERRKKRVMNNSHSAGRRLIIPH